MKKRLKTVTHQGDQLKEEIKKKEEALVKAHQEHQQLEREKESLKVRVLTQTHLITKDSSHDCRDFIVFLVCGSCFAVFYKN